jgi:hypothetical protein
MPRQPAVSPRRDGKLLRWLRSEAIATLAVAGTALTLLAELTPVIAMSPRLANVLHRWRDLTNSLWHPPFDLAGVKLHPDIAAALTIAAFLIAMGIGGRIAALRSDAPLPRPSARRFWTTDDQSWQSLLAFGAVCIVFLLGRTSLDQQPLTVLGSEQWGEWLFAGIGAAGYLLGSFIGEGAFHRRLVRTIALVALILAADFALRAMPGSIG